MKVLRIILLIVFTLPALAFAQEEQTVTVTDSSNLILNKLENGSKTGKITYVQDPRLTHILRKQVEFNKSNGERGWRILIFKGREMSRANQARAIYEEVYSHLALKVNIEYNEPDFSVLVGKFRTKEDAYVAKQKLTGRFPQAYIVQARITQE